jgi:hypothetical protein
MGKSVRRSILCAVLFLGLTVPSTAGPWLPSAGVIPTGHRKTGRFICDLFLEFKFAGRMPAGSKAVNVTAGTGRIVYYPSCGNFFDSHWHGDTPSGSFDWTCHADSGQIPAVGPAGGIGDRIRASAICETVGYPGSFRLTVDVVQLDQGTPNDGDFETGMTWAVVGAYHVQPLAKRPI